MNLKNLSDQNLIQQTDRAVQVEREALTSVLHHLKEIDRRRLYSDYQCRSLFDFAIKRYGYSEDQAWARISAMRLMKEIPEIEEKIEQGTLSLSNIGMAQSQFRKEKTNDLQRKREVLLKLEGVTKKEASVILKKESNPSFQEEIEIKFKVSPDLAKKFERLRGITAHSHKDRSQLFEALIELGLEEFDPLRKSERALKRQTKNNQFADKKTVVEKIAPRTNPTALDLVMNEVATSDNSTTKSEVEAAIPKDFETRSLVPGQKRRVENQTPKTTYIHATLRHEVWMRDGGACANCGSSHAVQVEHIIPRAIGGENTPENLKLLCRNCNQRSAVKFFGAKMDRYLKEPVRLYQ